MRILDLDVVCDAKIVTIVNGWLYNFCYLLGIALGNRITTLEKKNRWFGSQIGNLFGLVKVPGENYMFGMIYHSSEFI